MFKIIQEKSKPLLAFSTMACDVLRVSSQCSSLCVCQDTLCWMCKVTNTEARQNKCNHQKPATENGSIDALHVMHGTRTTYVEWQWIYTSPHLFYSGRVAHKIAVRSLHSLLCLGHGFGFIPDFRTSCFLSFSAVRLLVVLGCPTCPWEPMSLLSCSGSFLSFRQHFQFT